MTLLTGWMFRLRTHSLPQTHPKILIKIIRSRVNMWATKFGTELWESLTVATRRDTIQQVRMTIMMIMMLNMVIAMVVLMAKIMPMMMLNVTLQ